jgi:hypothetical protein
MIRSPINWESLYSRLEAPICSINCGLLCAPYNGGVPRCCINNHHEPVLFTSELAWLATKTDLWRLKPLCTEADRKEAELIEDYIKYAFCKGIDSCERPYRSLTCRFFPLEPYFEPGKKFAGLTFIYRARHECPLIDHPTVLINQTYVDQAIDVWNEIFARFPREVECYIGVSRGLRMTMGRLNKRIKVFSQASPG